MSGLYDDDCEHGMPSNGCAMCESPPAEINKVVFVTAGGSHFHNDTNCLALHGGQDEARDRGDTIHDIRATSWALVRLERSPCRTCVPKS